MKSGRTKKLRFFSLDKERCAAIAVFDKYTLINFQYLLSEIELWMNNYESEVEQLDDELLRLRTKKEAQSEKINRLRNIYAMRKKEIEDYLEVKQIRIELEELEEERNRAAEIIQVDIRVFLNYSLRNSFVFF